MFGHKRTGIQATVLGTIILPRSGGRLTEGSDDHDRRADLARLQAKEKFMATRGLYRGPL